MGDSRGKRSHGLERARVEDLGRCAGIPTSRNVVLLGPVGTGKTHLATGLGIEAIKRGHHVAFYRASDLVRALTEARDARTLSRLQERLRRVALLIVDELGFVSFETVDCGTRRLGARPPLDHLHAYGHTGVTIEEPDTIPSGVR